MTYTEQHEMVVLVVEDEEFLQAHIVEQLRVLGYTQVYAATDSASALPLIDQLKPDALLLDIDLGSGPNGIALAKQALKMHGPMAIIFLTRLTEPKHWKAAEALGPVGYLVKPFLASQVHIALQTAMKIGQELGSNRHQQPTYRLQNALFFQEGTRYQKVSLESLLYLKANGRYCEVFTTHNNSIFITASLKSLLEQLADAQLLRTHRSYAVRFDAITRYTPTTLYVTGKELPIPVSKKYRPAVMEQLRANTLKSI